MKDAELTAKLKAICEKYEITIEWIPASEKNCANRAEKTIWIKEIENSGDFAVCLHEAGHVMCDPDQEPQTDREKLYADTKAWQRALEQTGNNFDAAGWRRLHDSLHQYYVSVMDSALPAHDLLVKATQQVPTIRSGVSSFGAPAPSSLSPKKSTKPQS